MKPYYDHGGITICHGDCLEILPQINADVVVTDPPYGIGWTRGLNKAAGSRRHDGIKNDEDTSVRDAALRILRGKPAVVFGSFYAPYPADLKQVLVWAKPADAGVVGSVTGFRRDAEPVFLTGPWPLRAVRWSSVLTSRANSIAHVAAATGHPHTKPLDLMRRIVSICPAGVIVDPFCGSGTTGEAAKSLGRRAVLIDIEERYCEIAAQRLAQEVLFAEVQG